MKMQRPPTTRVNPAMQRQLDQVMTRMGAQRGVEGRPMPSGPGGGMTGGPMRPPTDRPTMLQGPGRGMTGGPMRPPPMPSGPTSGPQTSMPPGGMGGAMMKRGGKVKSMSSGGSASKAPSASRRGDGIAQRGKTKGRMI
jgi:hypothetical protein